MGKCVLAQLISIPWAPSLLGANNVGCRKSSAAEEDKQHEKLSAKVKSNLSALSPTTKRDMSLRRVQKTDEKAAHLKRKSAYDMESLVKD